VTAAPSNANGEKRRSFEAGAQQVATVYARALLNTAEQAGKTDEIVAELDSLVVDLLDKLPQLEAVLNSMVVEPDQKIQLLDRLLGGKANPLLLNFLKTLARHDRLDVLRPVHQSIHVLLDELRHNVRVEVQAAAPLGDQERQQIVALVARLFGGQPVLVEQVQPELIGGLVMRVGDTVYDGSIATHLEKLRQQMIDRSVHEIQSRRDRFSSPTGN
jgi:F-type H+-transporting ATPase subunit delta